jgi:hypothetical protein
VSGIRTWSDEELSARLYQVRSELDFLHEQFSLRRSLATGVALAQAHSSVQEAIDLLAAAWPSAPGGPSACPVCVPNLFDAGLRASPAPVPCAAHQHHPVAEICRGLFRAWEFRRTDGSVAICRWCQQEQNVTPGADESHGICPRHLAEQKARALEIQRLRRAA